MTKSVLAVQLLCSLVGVSLLIGCSGGSGGSGGNELLTNPDVLYVFDNLASTVNVLDNDQSGLSVVGFTQASKGAVQHLQNGVFSYFPNIGWDGVDSFTYTVSSGGATKIENVSVTRTFWHRPMMINSGTRTNMFDQTLIVDAAGTVTATWGELVASVSDPWGDYRLYSRQYRLGIGWRPIKQMVASGIYSNTGPRIVANNPNGLTAVWNQSDGKLFSVYSSQYDNAGESWNQPIKLNSDTEEGTCNATLADSNGVITSVWKEGDFSAPETIVARRFEGVNGWSSSVDISQRGVFIDWGSCHAIVSSSGQVTVIWTQIENPGTASTTRAIWLNQYMVGTGWIGPKRVGEGASFESGSSVVTDDGKDNVLVAWRNESRDKFWAARFDNINGTATPVRLPTAHQVTQLVGIYADGNGNGILLWLEDRGYWNLPRDLYAAEYAPSIGWKSAVRLNPASSGVYDAVAHDSAGKVIVASLEGDSSASITVREYSHSSAWQAPLLLSGKISTERAYFTPKIASNSGGEAMLIWPEKLYSSGSARYRLWAARRDSSGAWEPAIPLQSGVIVEKQYTKMLPDDVTDISVVLDDLGNATAFWTEFACDPADLTGYKCWSLWGTRYEKQ